jgi:hypothetical protein
VTTVALGAPGIYFAKERAVPVLGGVRLDVAAFLGVAPRGPAREPDLSPDPLPDGPTVHLRRRRTVALPIDSFAEYRRHFGGFEGPGRLPFAVASFFEQGGRRAYVARVVHDYGDPAMDAAGVAVGELAGVAIAFSGLLPRLLARSEGSWGNGLRAALGFEAAPLPLPPGPAPTAGTLPLSGRSGLPLGSLLRLRLPGGVVSFAFVAAVTEAPGGALTAIFDRILAAAPVAAELLLGSLLVDDGRGFLEEHRQLGLSSRHPRWLATVLCHQSNLLFPHQDWVDADLEPLVLDRIGGPILPPLEPPQFHDGSAERKKVLDRYPEIVPEDFFDAGWTFGDEGPAGGVHCLIGISEVAVLVAPDLYSPGPLVEPQSVLDPDSLAGPDFAPCFELEMPAGEQEDAPAELLGLQLDPRLPADFEIIVGLQQRLLELGERTGAFVALIDVPPGLSERRVLEWRSRFDSSWGGAYYPWLKVARPDDGRDALILLPPSAAAAGILARRELDFGVPHGPFGTIAAEVVALAEPVPGSRHDLLHQSAINVFQQERDGIRLTAGRTLSSEAAYRQLSVRRLMMLLVRAIERECQWLVFEPNGPALWSEIRHYLGAFLRRLFRAGAFRGAREEEAFFVACGPEQNPPRILDAGQLVVLIGVAPAEPLEFLVIRLLRGGDGSLSVED